MWHIEMMGTFRVTGNGREFAVQGSKRAASLLAFVAFMAGRPVGRDELTEAIWPNDDPEAARARLRTALSTLRKILHTSSQPDILLSDRQSVALNADCCTTDVSIYHSVLRHCGRAVDTAELESLLRKARDLYTGDLLPQFDEAWITIERQSLLTKHSEVLNQLSKLCTDRGANEEAAEFSRQQIAIDPLNEEAHLNLMALYVSLDMPVMAIKQYQQLEQLLSDHLQTRPSRKSKELYDQLRNSDSSRYQPTKSPANWWDLRNPKPLFGRETELQRLLALVAPSDKHRCEPRLVTVCGPGGVGKTHIAQIIAKNTTAKYMDNVWFVPLADLIRPHQISGAIADALRIERSSTAPLISLIADKLCECAGLLILDNFEHLIDGGKEVLEYLLQATTDLQILVTSRQHLNLQAEHIVELQPFHQPDLSHIHEMDDRVTVAASLPGVEIFMARARAVRPGITLAPDSVQAILDICSRLEGLPLSLEIAASRASVLSVQSLLSHLDDQLDLLVDHRSQSTLRHRSVRNTIQWSYNLLDPELKSLLMNLSIFRGGWLADAACAICIDPSTTMLRCLDLLDDLRTCSLINVSEVHGRIRFSMLYVITAFASELLAKSGGAEIVGDRHQQWFTNYVEERSPDSHGDSDAIFDEYPNIIRAIEHGTRPEACEYQSMLSLRICCAMKDFWLARGLAHEASLIVLRLAACEISAAARAKAQTLAARLLLPRGDYSAAVDLATEALSIANNRAVLHTAASARLVLARSACSRSEYDAAYEYADRACRDAEIGNYPEVQAESHILMGMTYWYTASFDHAMEEFEQALDLYRLAGSRRGEALCQFRISTIHRELGSLTEAESLINQALLVYKDLSDIGGIAMCVHELALVLLCLSDYHAALPKLQEALALYKQVGNRASTASCLAHLAEVYRETGNGTHGTPLLFEALNICRDLEDRRGEATVLQRIARFYRDAVNLSLAKSTLYQALEIETAIGSPIGIALCNLEIANLWLTLNDTYLARYYLRCAIKNLESIIVTQVHAEVLAAFADSMITTGELELAVMATAAWAIIRDELPVNLQASLDPSNNEHRKTHISDRVGEDQFTLWWLKALAMGVTGLLAQLARTEEDHEFNPSI